jgi:hypothetical protein
MLFDSTLLFYHSGTTYAFTAGEFVSLVGVTSSTASGVINLGNARDMGIGEGEERPNVFIAIGGGGITSSSTTLTVNFQFQGSTDSVTWTTYMETGANATTGLTAGTQFVFPVPARPPGAALPLYYRLNTSLGTNATAGISTGGVLAGIVLAPAQGISGGQYPAGFTVS